MKNLLWLLVLVTLLSIACKSSPMRSQIKDSDLAADDKATLRSVLYPESLQPSYKVRTDFGEQN